MLDAEFAINARPETVTRDFRHSLRPWGYLVPPSGLTRGLTTSLRTFYANHIPLVIDNGQFEDISHISAEFANSIAATQTELAALEGRLKRTVLWRDLPNSARKRRERLATALQDRAATITGMPLVEQMALASNGVIGAEDITGALWLRAGLDAPTMPRARTRLRRCNEAVAKAARFVVNSLPAAARASYCAVASAFDYDTAFDAGRAFGDASLPAAALGFGAFMADNSFTDRVVINGRSHSLDQPLPMRYLRTALVARGFWDGWKTATGGSPRRFHFLGLGAPIMMPLVSLAARGTPLLTFDATSPIRDAVEGTIYSSRGAYLKIRTRRLAERLTTGQLRSWNCPCGFCRAFVSNHPFDYERGRAWGRSSTPPRPITARDLQPRGALYSAYPLFAEPRGGELRGAVSYARSGHNHWVISDVMHDIRKHGKNRRTLEKHVRHIVDRYQIATSSSYFADAVSLAFKIVTGKFPG